MIIYDEQSEHIIDTFLSTSPIVGLAPDVPEQVLRTIVFDYLAGEWPDSHQDRQDLDLGASVDAVLAKELNCQGDRRDMVYVCTLTNEIVDRLLLHGRALTMGEYLEKHPEHVAVLPNHGDRPAVN